MLVGQGVKVSDSGVALVDAGVLDAIGACDGVTVVITVGVLPVGKVSVAASGVTANVDDGVGVVLRKENNQ